MSLLCPRTFVHFYDERRNGYKQVFNIINYLKLLIEKLFSFYFLILIMNLICLSSVN